MAGGLPPYRSKENPTHHEVMTRYAIPLKQWRYEEAVRLGVSPWVVWYRLRRRPLKYYPAIKLRRVNQRVVFVTEQA